MTSESQVQETSDQLRSCQGTREFGDIHVARYDTRIVWTQFPTITTHERPGHYIRWWKSKLLFVLWVSEWLLYYGSGYHDLEIVAKPNLPP